MKKTMEQAFKAAMDSNGKPSVYFQLDIPGTGCTISEKVDGMMGVTFKRDGSKQEVQAVMALPPSVQSIEHGVTAMTQAITMTLLSGTDAGMADIHDMLQGAVYKGMTNALIDIVGEEDPKTAVKIKAAKALLDILNS